MDTQAKIELLKQDSFAFDVDLTLNELDWTRVLGPNGLGRQLLQKMATLGAESFQFGEIDHVENGTCEIFSFEVEGSRFELRLDYEQPITATLQTAVRQVLDGVNRALRRQTVPYRFVCVRDTCTGAGCTYRLMQLPTQWLREMEDALNIVAGLSLEDYEMQPPYGGRPQAGGGFIDAR
ncbi:hypothetical protein FIV42_12765 [Persicimonas caeni]|uniref:Uncharacterized protein n=1 Tax=Persicimonas caeni TaxID=2292766 RepID=A0A4Y6PTD5_PERCE|nr:hypothetical protein [Persicimonas caeni]QDG51586.1 hypothetical protein FIV42_12765 [Persicimonas caeni]QED32807.1 hypothetical protein FRD00_12760 [Persicimonas caeni]